MNFDYVDDVIRVNDKECFLMTRRLVREEGLYCGGSSGAAVAGALKYLRRHDREGLTAVVLLPDGASKYMSKIFDDNWMREGGYLQPDRGMGSVGDLAAGRGDKRELITVNTGAKITEVIGLLKLHGISQVPLLEKGKLKGMLFDKRLLESALEGGRRNALVDDLVDVGYCTVDTDTEIAVLAELFRRFKVAVVLDEGSQPMDIITRIDLIDYMSQVAGGQ
jgi:cystathionine beta-synthase